MIKETPTNIGQNKNVLNNKCVTGQHTTSKSESTTEFVTLLETIKANDLEVQAHRNLQLEVVGQPLSMEESEPAKIVNTDLNVVLDKNIETPKSNYSDLIPSSNTQHSSNSRQPSSSLSRTDFVQKEGAQYIELDRKSLLSKTKELDLKKSKQEEVTDQLNTVNTPSLSNQFSTTEKHGEEHVSVIIKKISNEISVIHVDKKENNIETTVTQTVSSNSEDNERQDIIESDSSDKEKYEKLPAALPTKEIQKIEVREENQKIKRPIFKGFEDGTEIADSISYKKLRIEEVKVDETTNKKMVSEHRILESSQLQSPSERITEKVKDKGVEGNAYSTATKNSIQIDEEIESTKSPDSRIEIKKYEITKSALDSSSNTLNLYQDKLNQDEVSYNTIARKNLKVQKREIPFSQPLVNTDDNSINEFGEVRFVYKNQGDTNELNVVSNMTKFKFHSENGVTSLPTQNNRMLTLYESKTPELIQFIRSVKVDEVNPKQNKSNQNKESKISKDDVRLQLLSSVERPELEVLDKAKGNVNRLAKTENIISAIPTLTHEQEVLLKEFMMDTAPVKDQKTNEKDWLGYLRLGELPTSNVAARKALITNFSKFLQQDMASSSRHNQQWQKHSFNIGNGDIIDMKTKNIDGIIHVKLAASNPELSRLILLMEQEIKDHLKEKLEIDLDLQFENKNQESFSDSFNNDGFDRKKTKKTHFKSNSKNVTSQEVAHHESISIRHFGYNQMEWTI